jgi:hypothetical protein
MPKAGFKFKALKSLKHSLKLQKITITKKFNNFGPQISINFTCKNHFILAEPRSEPASAHSSPIRVRPARLPSSSLATPPKSPVVKFADGGAHWYRASAVLLRYHRWFNDFENIPKGDPPVIYK